MLSKILFRWLYIVLISVVLLLSIISLSLNRDFEKTTTGTFALLFGIIGIFLNLVAITIYILLYFRAQHLYRVLMITADGCLSGGVIFFGIATGLLYGQMVSTAGAWMLATTWSCVAALICGIMYTFVEWDDI